MSKLSASGLSLFLKSPRAYYWRYIAKLEPISLSVGTYDHDKICGVLWSEFLERFYSGVPEADNLAQTLAHWDDQTSGWVPDKPKDKLTKALESWSATYYSTYSPADGVRCASEVYKENDRFLGFLDGISEDGIIHEVKSTSRSPNLSGQLWKVQNSIQVKLYAVLANASGIRIEFAFKDPPYAIFRSEPIDVTDEQRKGWEQELNTLHDYIQSLGTDIHNFACNPDSCCLVTKGITSMCQYETLCDMGLTEDTRIIYKEKSRRK